MDDDAPFVLLVEDDRSLRLLVRQGLELEGARVIEAETLAQARALLDEPFEGVVLDRRLPDGRGEELLPELLAVLPASRIIVHSTDGGLEGFPEAPKGDIDAIAAQLRLDVAEGRPTAAGRAQATLGRLHREWVDLCRWDPALAPDARPPVAETMIGAVTAALERPQPIGWGLDPSLEPVADAFGLNVGDVPTALAELVCLREAFTRIVVAALPQEDQLEAAHRLQMVIDRTMLVIVETGVRRLREQALSDSLTGLGNRRALEQDLKRELHRASRHGHPLTVAVIDVDGLKVVNDTHGHHAGDALLRRVAAAIRMTVRDEDIGYRLGGDEFALLLVEAVYLDADGLTERLLAAGSPPISVGVASGIVEDPWELVELADQQLYERRRAARGVDLRG
jgi:diguanylate cyclase (GGDEF)-like protein